MLNHVEQFIKQYNLADKTIYIACSGGVDSMVLSHCLRLLNVEHSLLHCNFRLRGEDSDEDEAFVIKHAEKYNIPYHTLAFDTQQYCEINHLTIQEGARELRYDWFKNFINKENAVLFTAHHLDDQIETFFINLLRGTGLKGLTGIPNQKHQIYRPLLELSKDEILKFSKKNKIKYREDQSNNSDNYLRNRLRHHHIKNLKKETTNFNHKIKQLFNELNDIDAYLDEQITSLKTILFNHQSIEVELIKELPGFLIVRLFSNYNLTRKKTLEFKKFIQSKTGSIFETTTHTFLKDRQQIVIQPKSVQAITESFKIFQVPFEQSVNNQIFKLSFKNVDEKLLFDSHLAYIDADKIELPIIIRKWKKGDKIQPLGMKGSKLISDILGNQKVNRFDKDKQLVFESNGQVFWLVDSVVNDKFKITNHTKRILFIEHIK